MIPTPGHTPGSTCFLVCSPHGKRYLFAGDTLYLGKGATWKAGFLFGISDREALADSLALLRDVEPDVVLSSACADGIGVQEISPDEWPGHVEAALAHLLP